jgi:hypothetical protein
METFSIEWHRKTNESRKQSAEHMAKEIERMVNHKKFLDDEVAKTERQIARAEREGRTTFHPDKYKA